MKMSSEKPTRSKYVTLESSDGFLFVVDREAALVSGTLRGILETSCMSKWGFNYFDNNDRFDQY